jgi:EAL domain-containing protein (putative c-di-GMP-specific phosphodiesterase class I)/GGDEF domain-containing protein
LPTGTNFRAKRPQAVPAAAGTEVRSVGAAEPDAIDAALALGSRLLNCPLFHGATADDLPIATRPGAPTAHFVADTVVETAAGRPAGIIRATAPRERPAFRPAERDVLDDVARVVAGLTEARAALGRTDHVTLLPNRQSFLEEASRPHDGSRLVVLVTLSDARQFNEVLRALGHDYAEAFVREGARRIRTVVQAEVTVFHVSVLSFALILDVSPEDGVPAIVPALAGVFRDPIVCHAVPVAVRVGIGMSALPPPPNAPSEALRAALTAAQDSRYRDRPWARYDRRTDEAHRRAFTLINDLHRAIESDDELHLVYQPRIRLRTGRTVGAEALLRWRHPELGAVSPGEFIPLAEATALVDPLTDWVIRAAARQAAAWRADDLDLCLSINIAPANLRERDFATHLVDLVERHRVPLSGVEVEITEGTATSGDAEVLQQLEAIGRAGMKVAIDDFGTGYSNLAYLTHLPASVLKIDQSFIRPLEQDPRRQMLVRSVIDLAHGLGFEVVAEGIETDTAYRLLDEWHCDEGQGFLMSRPLSPADFRTWLAGR